MNYPEKQVRAFISSPLSKVTIRVRLLEMGALFGFLALATIGWSYHGNGRPWQLYAAADILVLACFVAECLFCKVKKLRAQSD